MKTLIVDNHTKHLVSLVELFPDAEIIKKEAISDGSVFAEYDIIVFSGGSSVPTVLRHPEEYEREVGFIKTTKSKVLGICLGAEIITQAFGGELKELSKDYRGDVQIVIDDNDLQEVIGTKEFQAKESHGIGIKKIPDGFCILAHSEHGPEIIKHDTNPILAIQFHPELTDNDLLKKWIISQFY